MKLKLIVSVLALVAVIGGIVYAQTGEDRIPWSARFELTEEQSAELNEIREEMQDLRERMVDKMVEFGVISAERAQWIKEGWRLQQEEWGEFGPGYGPCHGTGGMHHRHHRRMMGSWGW